MQRFSRYRRNSGHSWRASEASLLTRNVIWLRDFGAMQQGSVQLVELSA
jgi:hypothetical protein